MPPLKASDTDDDHDHDHEQDQGSSFRSSTDLQRPHAPLSPATSTEEQKEDGKGGDVKEGEEATRRGRGKEVRAARGSEAAEAAAAARRTRPATPSESSREEASPRQSSGETEEEEEEEGSDTVKAVWNTLEHVAFGTPLDNNHQLPREGDFTWSLSASEFATFSRRWKDPTETDLVARWAGDKARLEYFSGELRLRMPSPVHDYVAGKLQRALTDRLTDALRPLNDPEVDALGVPTEHFSSDILANEQGTSNFCPDGGVRFPVQNRPGCIIEMVNSNDLPLAKIRNYFYQGNGNVCSVVVPTVKYLRPENRKKKRGLPYNFFVTIYRMRWNGKRSDDGRPKFVPRKVLDLYEIPDDPAADDGVDFFLSDFHADFQQDNVEDERPAFRIPSTLLRTFLRDAVVQQEKNDTAGKEKSPRKRQMGTPEADMDQAGPSRVNEGGFRPVKRVRTRSQTARAGNEEADRTNLPERRRSLRTSSRSASRTSSAG